MKKRLVGIDVLRGVAAFAVVLSHVHKWNVDACGRLPALVCGSLSRVLDSMGAWGVGLFFVLSGLCIHLPAARATARGETPSIDVGQYASRRFWRIYPPHLGALLLSWAVAAVITPPANFEPMLSVPTHTQLVAHLFLVHSFMPTAVHSINAVLWTIAIEAHFYVLYPLLTRWRRRVSMPAVTAALFAVSLGLRLLSTRSQFASILVSNFPGRWWEWTLGACVAEAATSRRWSQVSVRFFGVFTLGSLLLVAAVERLPHGILLRDVFAPFSYAALALAAMTVQFDRSLWATPALWLGHRSYSLYLVHPIALTVTLAAAPKLLPWAGVVGWMVLATAASAAGAAGYFALVERWFVAGRSPMAPGAAVRTAGSTVPPSV